MRVRGFVAAAFALLSCTTFAAQQRSFVSGNGNDGNNCTLVAPCRSFGAAIAQTLDAGEIVVLDSAGYGPVTITKSVTIAAPTGVYAGITVFSGDAITIDGLNIKVGLIGLTIVGQGGNNGSKGISLVKDADVAIERCRVSGVSNGLNLTGSPTVLVRGSTFTGNHNFGIVASGQVAIHDTSIDRNGPGILVNAGALSLVNSTVNLNAFNGLTLFPATVATVDRSVFYGNSIAGVVVFGGPNAMLTLTRSLVERNGNVGMEIDGYGSVTDSVVARNADSGIATFSAGARVTLESTKITDNGNYGIRIVSGVVQTLQNNTIVNNSPSNVSGTLTPMSLQ